MAHHHFTPSVLPAGKLTKNIFGRLVAKFEFASHVPLAGGHPTDRHIFLALRVPSGNLAGLYEAAVNIRSDQQTEVLFTERLENLKLAEVPAPGFQDHLKLTYGTGPSNDNVDHLGLPDGDFQKIANDALFDKVNNLTQGCDVIAVYGVTYTQGSGIHDVHMNSGTKPGAPHANDDRKQEDGAIAFYFDLGDGKAFAHWIFVKFDSQTVVNFS